MAITTHYNYSVTCDRCGEKPDEHESYFDTVEDAIADALEFDWVAGDDEETVYCVECATPDDEMRAWERYGEPDDPNGGPYCSRKDYDRVWADTMRYAEQRSLTGRVGRAPKTIVLPGPLGWDYWAERIKEHRRGRKGGGTRG